MRWAFRRGIGIALEQGAKLGVVSPIASSPANKSKNLGPQNIYETRIRT